MQKVGAALRAIMAQQFPANQPQPNATATAAPISQRVGRSVHPRIPATETYHRIICVVPLIGTGRLGDAKRPMYIPADSGSGPSRQGIIAFQQIPTDDGRFAIVEYVAADRAAFAAILNNRTLQIFERGKHSRALIEQALKLVRKDFDLTRFGMAAL